MDRERQPRPLLAEYDEEADRLKYSLLSKEELLDLLIRAYRMLRVTAKDLDEQLTKIERMKRSAGSLRSSHRHQEFLPQRISDGSLKSKSLLERSQVRHSLEVFVLEKVAIAIVYPGCVDAVGNLVPGLFWLDQFEGFEKQVRHLPAISGFCGELPGLQVFPEVYRLAFGTSTTKLRAKTRLDCGYLWCRCGSLHG